MPMFGIRLIKDMMTLHESRIYNVSMINSTFKVFSLSFVYSFLRQVLALACDCGTAWNFLFTFLFVMPVVFVHVET